MCSCNKKPEKDANSAVTQPQTDEEWHEAMYLHSDIFNNQNDLLVFAKRPFLCFRITIPTKEKEV